MRGGLELAGRFRLEEPLGRGGMGEVWRGVDLRLRRPVAVKLLPLVMAADPAAVARFRREAEIAATLNHPGITTVFDIDEHRLGDERLLFLVMELMRGRDLQRALAEHPGGMPVERVEDLAVQVLDAMSAAHGLGIVHRDLKPANLFLLESGGVKVCDFGIARLAGATKITATGGSAGTPLYMAPEQIQGRTADQRTDLYAFGCVLYEMLTGTSWVDTGSGMAAILYQHLEQTPAPPSSLRPDVPGHLDALVLDLLAKRPDDRPYDASAVIARLHEAPAVAPRAPNLGMVPPPPPLNLNQPPPSLNPEPMATTSPPGPEKFPTNPPSSWGRGTIALVVLAICALVAGVAGIYFWSGSDVTPSGRTLKLGTQAIVFAKGPMGGLDRRVGLRVESIVKVPVADFTPEDGRALGVEVPYCIHFSLKNLSDDLMDKPDADAIVGNMGGILPGGGSADDETKVGNFSIPKTCKTADAEKMTSERNSTLEEAKLVFAPKSIVVKARWEIHDEGAGLPSNEYKVFWK
ncbi:serine/threonine-protein kinase [Spirillospora sp. NPDC052269]